MSLAAPIVLLDLVRRERLKRAAESSLHEFTKQAWPIIEFGTEFVDNWHLHLICERLEAVHAGEIKNLLINIPPGCMKSILTSVMFPPWEWLDDPKLRFLGASYSEDLAVRDAMKSRDIITSPWYQERWGEDVRIRPDMNQKIKYQLIEGGWRLSTSVGGKGTGEHPDRKLVDDPHNVKQAESDAERTTGLNWFDRTLGSRGVSRGAATIAIMQRLHEQDVSGHIMEGAEYSTEWEHLCLPMRFELPVRHMGRMPFVDPRKEPGELLWPQLFDEKTVKSLEVRLGSYGAAGQLQQRPSPLGGGMVKEGWFKLWTHGRKLPRFEYILQVYDTAMTEKTQNDPTGTVVFGVFSLLHNKKAVMVLDAWDERLEYPKLRKRAISDAKARYGPNDATVDLILIELKNNGYSLMQELGSAPHWLPAAGWDPGTQDKVARLTTVLPLIEAGLVFVPESQADPGQPVTWARPMIKQLTVFPNAAHDEYADCLSMGLKHLKDSRFLSVDVAEDEDDMQFEPEPLDGRYANPYAS